MLSRLNYSLPPQSATRIEESRWNLTEAKTSAILVHMAATITHPKRKPAKAAKRPPRKLTNAKLLKLASKHRPPQSWFDETDVPFKPAKD
jgi:hypothetical protein